MYFSEISQNKLKTLSHLQYYDHSTSSQHTNNKNSSGREPTNKLQPFSEILLYESEYVPYEHHFNQSTDHPLYYQNNINPASRSDYSKVSSEVSEDSLSQFLTKLFNALVFSVKNQYAATFEVLMNVPMKKYSEFDPGEYRESNEELQFQLSDDDEEQYPQTRYKSLCNEGKQNSQVTFGQTEQIEAKMFGFRKEDWKKSEAVQKSKNICLKLEIKALPFPANARQNPIQQLPIQTHTYEKMQQLSRLVPDLINGEFMDNHNQLSFFDELKFMGAKQESFSLDLIQSKVSNIFDGPESSIINKISELKDHKKFNGNKEKQECYVKQIKESVIVCEPRPTSYYQNCDKASTSRPVSYHHSPPCQAIIKGEQKHIRQNNDYGMKQMVCSPQKISALSPTKQCSKITERTQKSPENKLKKPNYQTKNYNQINQHANNSPYMNFQGQNANTLNRYNSLEGPIKVLRAQYFSPNPQPFRQNPQQPYLNRQPPRNNYPYMPQEQVFSPRSAPASPMIFRNFKEAPFQNDSTNNNFRRVNPQGIQSTQQSFNSRQTTFTQKQASTITNTHSYYLGHLHQQETRKQQKQHQTKRTQKYQIPRREQDIIHQQYFDYDKNTNNQMSSRKKKIHLVTHRDQILVNKKNKK